MALRLGLAFGWVGSYALGGGGCLLAATVVILRVLAYGPTIRRTPRREGKAAPVSVRTH